MKKNVIVYGMGYVGLANAVLLSQDNKVVGIEIAEKKLEMLRNKISPLEDKEIIEYLTTRDLDFTVKASDDDFAKNADVAIIATPTNYDEEKGFFDTSSVDNVVENLSKMGSKALVVIKSTIPIGYTKRIQDKYPNLTIVFSPEFLREGQALKDNLYPARIIVGCNMSDPAKKEQAQMFAELLKEGAIKKDVPLLVMNYKEAESVKLFSNTYLAMRVAYFNEIDDFAIKHNLNTREIIEGMCADPRIGNYYNNPSFGYGGYCFPKDTKQLKANYVGIPNSLIDSIVDSNMIRKSFIASSLLEQTLSTETIGIYRLIMKANSDNCRSSAIYDIIKMIAPERKILIYEPNQTSINIENCEITHNLEEFKQKSDIVVANRIDAQIKDVRDKVYTRDVFSRD